MPSLAWEALEAEVDGPAVLRMAALERPSGFETEALLTRFMAETGLCGVSTQIAYARLAQSLALRILRDGMDPLRFTAEMEGLWMRAGYPEQLASPGMIHEDVEVDRYYRKSEESTRKWVLERLRLATDQELP